MTLEKISHPNVGDFDETLPGPVEHDVERMAASFAIAAYLAGSAVHPVGWGQLKAPDRKRGPAGLRAVQARARRAADG